MTNIDTEKAINELKEMQKVLDDKENEMEIAEIRNILGHVVFSLVILIEENTKVRNKFEKTFTEHIGKKGGTPENLYS